MIRRCEPGWLQLLPFDEAGRRSLWIRVSSDKVELCAGREGDDAYVVLPLTGAHLSLSDLQELHNLATAAIYSQEIDA